jgi:transposase
MNRLKNPPAAPWRISDLLWHRIEAVLDALDPPKSSGRPRADRRLLLEGIVYRLKTGRPWRELPRAYGDDSTAHRAFHRWDEAGAFERIWDLLSREHPDLKSVAWRWEPVAPPRRPDRLKRAQ